MSEELKACPFCGCEDVEVFHHPDRGGMIGDSWHVECGAEKCGNGTCHHETKAEAITAWNTRATDAENQRLRAEVEALREAMREMQRANIDRIIAVKAAGDALAGFAGHGDECAISKWLPRGDMCPDCTCGLTDKLKQWKESSDGL